MAIGNQHRDDHRHFHDGVLIQNTQNRDTLALQIKLSELIVAMRGADNNLATIEDATDEELKKASEEVKTRSEEISWRMSIAGMFMRPMGNPRSV